MARTSTRVNCDLMEKTPLRSRRQRPRLGPVPVPHGSIGTERLKKLGQYSEPEKTPSSGGRPAFRYHVTNGGRRPLPLPTVRDAEKSLDWVW
jgi:hypothetical protein